MASYLLAMRKYLLLAALLLVNTAVSSNVIFPAFAAPYVSVLFLPLALAAVLVIETALYKYLDKSLSIPVAILLVIVANTISWFVGMAIALVLPDGLAVNEKGMLVTGHDFSLYAKLAFGVAYILSVAIEAAVLKVISMKIALVSPVKISLLSNTASYFVLSVTVWVLW